MPAPLVAFLALLDVLMVGTGYVAEQASEPAQIWVMFCLSTAFFIGILWMLLAYMRKLSLENKGSIEERAFRFLAVWTTVLWCAYPIIFILFKAGCEAYRRIMDCMRLQNQDGDQPSTASSIVSVPVSYCCFALLSSAPTDIMLIMVPAVIDRYVESIIHVVLDFFAKGLFGMILVGSREVLENEHTCEALLAMALLGIRPNEHGKITRRASMSAAHMPAIEAVRGGDDAPVYVEVDISGYAHHDGQQHHSQAQGYASHTPMPVPMPTSSSAGLVHRQQSRKGGYSGSGGGGGNGGGGMRPTQAVFSFSVDEESSLAPALSLPPRGVSANPAASPAGGGMRGKGKGKGAAGGGGGGGPLTSPANGNGGFVSTSEATAAAARRASASRAAAVQATTAAAAALPGRDSPDRHPGMVSYDMYAVRQAEAAAAAAVARGSDEDDEDDDEEEEVDGDYDGDVDFTRPDGVRLVYGSLDEDRKPRTAPAIVPPLNTGGGGMGAPGAGTGAAGAGGAGGAGGADPFMQLMTRAQGNPALMAQMMALMLQAHNNMGSPQAASGAAGAAGGGSAGAGGQGRPGLELTSPASRGGRM